MYVPITRQPPSSYEVAQRRNVTVSLCASSSQKAGDMIEMATSDGLLCLFFGFFLTIFLLRQDVARGCHTRRPPCFGPSHFSLARIRACRGKKKVTSRFFPDGRSLTRRRGLDLDRFGSCTARSSNSSLHVYSMPECVLGSNGGKFIGCL